jgi:hypothetical protein
MKTMSTRLKVLTCAVFILAFASFAQAQATRTWVSGVGDDLNPCSRTAPCKTFAGAISKTAVNGEIDCLDPGGFGTVTITKAITIDGTTGAGFGSILATGTNGVNVNISAPVAADTKTVILRNLSINGTGGINGPASSGIKGIAITAADIVSIENCYIFGFTRSTGRGISDDRISGSKVLHVYNTVVEQSGQFGIAISGGVSQGDLNGVTVRGSGSFGVVVAGGAKVTIRNSVVTQNALNAGIDVEGGSVADIENTMLSHNLTGLTVAAASTARISNVSMVQNGTGLSNSGTVRSFGNNKVDGNTTAQTTGNAVQGPSSGGPSQL